MDSFWSKLLILGIVAAIGLFFIGNVYNPQKAAQEAMADSTQQSVNAVKVGVEDGAPTIVKGDAAISTVSQYCKAGNTIPIRIKNAAGTTYTFMTSTSASGSAVTSVVVLNSNYVKTVNKNGGVIESIDFVEQ